MKKSILPILILGSLISCKKSEVTPANPCAVSSASIVGTYTIASMKYKASASSTEVDLLADEMDCKKDNTYQLKADGSIVSEDAGVTCNMPPEPGLLGWLLKNNNTVISLDEHDYTIDKFDCSSLVLSETGVSDPGDKKTITYIKQK